MWTVTAVSGRFREMSITNQLAHEFEVTLRFRHTAAPHGPYVEMPRLVWREKIVYKNYKTMKFWEWGAVSPQEKGGDLYGYSPDAGTFSAWRQRYVLPYQNANHERSNTYHGECQLTAYGRPVTIQMIQAAVAPSVATSRFRPLSFMQRRDRTPARIGDNEDKAKAVRSYIHQNNCELTIKIIDRPGMSVIDAAGHRNAERLLLFNCGVVGQTIKAHQLLRTQSPDRSLSETKHFALNWPTEMTLPLDGFSPDMDKRFYSLQYEHRLLAPPDTGNHALSLEIDGHLGNGQYR